MRRATLFAGVILLAASLAAAPHLAFETEAVTRAVFTAEKAASVFSPYAFEFMSAVLADSLDTIGRANMAERMGVLVDFETAFAPAREAFANRTNGFSFVSARAFLLPNLRTSVPAFRQFLLRDYGVATCRAFPAKGAEAWLKAEMDGEMEDFAVPISTSTAEFFSFYDLVSVRAAWDRPFDVARTKPMAFHCLDGATNEVAFMCGRREVAGWETKDYDFIRLPLRGGANFYALLPKEGHTLQEVRTDFSPAEVDNFLSIVDSVTEKGVWKGVAELAIPRLSVRSWTNLSPLMRYFRFPQQGFLRVAGALPGRDFVQVMRFELTERAADEPPACPDETETLAPDPSVRRLVFDRPFFYFIHHPDSSTLPVAGQFTGH